MEILMTMFLELTQDPDLDQLYPSSDGKPMAENTLQYRWIVLIKENLELILAAVENVFIAADLLWYPLDIRTLPSAQRPKVPPAMAPDVMVVFGRPKGDRPSYRQWMEENISPQVVFEILSESNRTLEGREQMNRKFEFYQQYGVEEYYIYDPDLFELQGWRRQGKQLKSIEQLSGWISPRLKIVFQWQPGEALVLLRPDGQRFLSLVEVDQQAKAAEEALRVEQARSQQMAALLRSMGIDPENLPES
jgi:Uma2 family endonuclease